MCRNNLIFMLGMLILSVLLGNTPIAADDTHYVDEGESVWYWDDEEQIWVIIPALPEILVEAPPYEEEEDPGMYFRYGLYHFWYDFWLWYYLDPNEEPEPTWDEGEEEDLEIQVFLSVDGSTTIDCAPTGGMGTDDRKRDMWVWTNPPFPDLIIDELTAERNASPTYGHNHSVDNFDYECRGALSEVAGCTGLTGRFEFYYRGPQAAGETIVSVDWTDPRTGASPSEGTLTKTFDNKHTGLVEITGGTGIYLTGHDTYHQAGDIHWATSTTKSRIETLASWFYNLHSENLYVNDSSLRYGGLYDYQENWDPPHNEHRDGKNVDIRPANPDSTKWADLKQKIYQMGSTFLDEIQSGNHLHFIE